MLTSAVLIKTRESLSGESVQRLHLHDSDAARQFQLAQGHSFEITLPGGQTRPLHGLIAKAARGQSTVRSTAYTLELRPWFYFLQLGSGCRVFQDKTVPEIITAVAKEAGYVDLKNSLSASYPKLEYVVQYNESDFDFLSRLMEEAGIFYYFTHEKTKHSMVLADSPQGCQKGPELTWIGENFPETPDASVWNVGLAHSVQPAMVQVDDYNCLTPAASLVAASGQGYPAQTEFGTGHSAQSEGETLASRRLDGFENAALELAAETSHSGLAAGMLVTLKGHPQKDFNKSWLITSLEMSVEENGHTHCAFTAIPGDKTFRPARRHPRPRVFGPLTGVVCGKAGEKIWVDEHGRVKIRFHWDHKTPSDEKSSAWLRVAQPWAGKGHGAMLLPRVGDEVLIDFLGGDPDRPIITASLYNAAHKTPWALTDNRSVTGLKDDGGNEIHLDDKKDTERLYFHAQKLLEIMAENERRVTVIGEGGDSLILEKGDRTVDIQKGNDSLKIKGNRTESVEGDYSITIKGDLKIRAKSITLESDEALTAKSGKAMEMQSGTDLKINAGTALDMNAKSTARLGAKTGATIDGGAQFKLAASAKGEVNGGAMLDVKGGLVKLN